MPKKKDDIREPISLRQWKRMRKGKAYESFHRGLDSYIGSLAGNLSDAIRNAWEIYLCQLVAECMDVDENSCCAPWHVPRAFGMMEWDLVLVSRLMDWVEGGDYGRVYAMDSDVTPPYLTDTFDGFIANEDNTELVLDSIERARRLDYESEKEKRRKGAPAANTAKRDDME